VAGSEGSIPISQKHGVNPALIICAQCGKETGALVLPGQVNRYSCADCGEKNIFLHRAGDGCPNCKNKHDRLTRTATDVEMPRHIRNGDLCDACAKKQEEMRAVVRDGGVYWKCKDCGSNGAIKADAKLAVHVRAEMKIQAPAPCGVEFCKEDFCPVCGPNKEIYDGKGTKADPPAPSSTPPGGPVP
jgi:hypothetical protein